MKPKSTKLRLLLTLQALFKQSDSEHRLTTVKFNEILKPYNLECTKEVTRDTIRVLREFGFDIRFSGAWDNQGFWIEDRPISEQQLHKLIYAVSTNPHISRNEATEILEVLKPFVTTYQEDELVSIVDSDLSDDIHNSLFSNYSVVNKAIQNKLRVRYTTGSLNGNKVKNSILFTPKYLYHSDQELYMIGYDHALEKIEAVRLRDIMTIRLVRKYKTPIIDQTDEILSNINPHDYIIKKIDASASR